MQRKNTNPTHGFEHVKRYAGANAGKRGVCSESLTSNPDSFGSGYVSISLQFCASSEDIQDARHHELPNYMDELNNVLSKHGGYMVIARSSAYQVSVYPLLISIDIHLYHFWCHRGTTFLHPNKNPWQVGRHLDSVSAGSISKCSKTFRVDTSRTVTRFDIPWPKDRRMALHHGTLEAGSFSNASA